MRKSASDRGDNMKKKQLPPGQISQADLSVVSELWSSVISPNAPGVFEEALSRAAGRSNVVGTELGYPSGVVADGEISRRVRLIAAGMFVFFGDYLGAAERHDWRSAVELAEKLGGSHSAIASRSPLQPLFWDIFILTFTEAVGSLAGCTADMQIAYMRFMRAVVEVMRTGYTRHMEHVRSERRGGSARRDGGARAGPGDLAHGAGDNDGEASVRS